MESHQITIYTCEYCRREFESRSDCEAHEKTHFLEYNNATNAELADALEYVATICSHYRCGNKVLGMPIESFHNLMHKSAGALMKGVSK